MVKRSDRQRCPDHPMSRVNDFGGAFVLCAVCSRRSREMNAHTPGPNHGKQADSRG